MNDNLLRSLQSLTKRDNYPMYTMSFYGDYHFEDFLKEGVDKEGSMLPFIRSRLVKDFEPNMPNFGCTAFIAKDENGDILYARNYDFRYAPSLLLETHAKGDYKSVSTVDMSFMGYDKERLPDDFKERLPLLATPYMPFDGMNEKGLAIAILLVPKADLPNDPKKITLNTTTINRLILNKAATVNEAIQYFCEYNIFFPKEYYCHYFIADQSGKSVIVEFWDGAMHITEENIATNFIAYNGLNMDGNTNPCERYNIVKSKLDINSGTLSTMEAASLLCDVACYDGESHILQWSVVYNLSALTGMIFPGRDISKPYCFNI